MRELSEAKPQFMFDGITNTAEHSALIKLRRAEVTIPCRIQLSDVSEQPINASIYHSDAAEQPMLHICLLQKTKRSRGGGCAFIFICYRL